MIIPSGEEKQYGFSKQSILWKRKSKEIQILEVLK